LKAAVQAVPQAAGIELAKWNWKGVRMFIQQRFGRQLGRSSCLNYLHRLGFVLKRPKKRLLKASAEKREAFVADYAALRIQAQEAGGKIFFVDEAHFRADHVDGTVWAWLRGLLTDPARLAESLQVQQSEREKALRPLRKRLSIVQELLADHRRQLEKLLDLYLAGDFPRDVLTERKARLEEIIARLEDEQAGMQAHLAEQVLTDEQVQTIEKVAAQVRADLALVDEAGAAGFEIKAGVVDLLDARARLVIEDGVRVCYARCRISPEVVLSVVSQPTVAPTTAAPGPLRSGPRGADRASGPTPASRPGHPGRAR